MSSKTGKPVPNARTIEALFRELSSYSTLHRDANRMSDKLQDLIKKEKEKFYATPKMVNLQRALDREEKKDRASRKKLEDRIRHVRQLFYTQGVTDLVVKETQKLVKDIAKWKNNNG